MSTQPEALRLAEFFESCGLCNEDLNAATELRRLHEANEGWQRDYDLLLAEHKLLVVDRQEYSTHAIEIARNAIEAEREACAKMFEDAPPLVEFVKNDKGGCMVCGFTPALAIQAIRARGQA